MNARISTVPRIRCIRTSAGNIRANFITIKDTNVLVLVDPRDAYSPGTIFVTNRELQKSSPNGTTHMAFKGGLYEAFRSGTHVVHRGGIRPQSKNGERQINCEDRETAIAFIQCLLASGLLTQKQKDEARLAIREIVDRYGAVRNDHKIEARNAFHRGIGTEDEGYVDSRGRKNLMASRMILGKGINELLKRNMELWFIGSKVDRRTVMIWQAVQSIVGAYQGLRRDLRLRPDVVDQLFSNGLPDTEGLFLLEKAARHHIDAIAPIEALPFRRNAHRTHMDLMQLIDASRKADEESLRSILIRMRRGITWVFAQRFLELEIINPLSFLLDELRREKRRRARREKTRQQPVVRSMDPERFGTIENALVKFLSRLKDCEDSVLANPVMTRAKQHIEAAKNAFAEENWRKAMLELKHASALM